MQKTFTIVFILVFGGLVAPSAHAQWAVVDVGAIAQLVQQIAKMEQQLTTMQAHLRQAEQEYQSITGDRGMENLLSGTVRNYLPPDWQTLQAAVTQTSSAYPALSAAVQSSLNSNAVLTPQQLTAMSPVERGQVVAARQSVAMLQATTNQALTTISGRFATIQQLIAAMGGLGIRKRSSICRHASRPSKGCSQTIRANFKSSIRPPRPSSGPSSSATESRPSTISARCGVFRRWVCRRAVSRFHRGPLVSARRAG